MAARTYALGDPEVVALWRKLLPADLPKKTYYKRFIGKGDDALAQELPETGQGAGDKVTCTLRLQPDGDGVTEGETLEGNEEAIATVSDQVTINELAHAFKSQVKIVQQRVPWSLGKAQMNALSDWFAIRQDTIFFNHLCGYSVETRPKFSGFNTITEPTAGRIIRAGTAGNDSELNDAAAEKFTLDLIDRAVETAKMATPNIRPLRVDGKETYVLFLHPYQVTALRTNTGAGQWLDIQKAAMSGGRVEDNPIFRGSLGMYNGVILHESTRITPGVHAGAAVANTRRAVLCGAQAIVCAYGKSYGPDDYEVIQKTFDYDRYLGISGLAIWGMKAARYADAESGGTTRDFGKIVISTYAAAA